VSFVVRGIAKALAPSGGERHQALASQGCGRYYAIDLNFAISSSPNANSIARRHHLQRLFDYTATYMGISQVETNPLTMTTFMELIG
jgi:hypothetical protein